MCHLSDTCYLTTPRNEVRSSSDRLDSIGAGSVSGEVQCARPYLTVFAASSDSLVDDKALDNAGCLPGWALLPQLVFDVLGAEVQILMALTCQDVISFCSPVSKR